MTKSENPEEISDSDLSSLATNPEEELRERGIYYIFEEITQALLKPIHQDILLKHCSPSWSDKRGITLIINSPGGELDPVWGLIDLLDFIRMPVTTLAMGSCASGATLLLASGTIKRRIIAANTTSMVHRFSWGNYDKHE